VTYAQGEAPDGTCVDADGGIWIAVVGGARIERRLPDGSLDLTIKVPVSRPTMPMLGAADGRTLFITSQRRFLASEQLTLEPLAGNLIAVRVSHSAHAPNLVKAKLC
jgi:sugar lactone lactonase YvrE